MTIEEKLNFKTLEWRGDFLRLIDQRRLPDQLAYFDCHNISDFIYAIKDLVVRGAPAIGCTAAYGIALAAKTGEDLPDCAAKLKDARPTAVNLAWAVDRMMSIAKSGNNDAGMLEKEALAIHREDAAMCRRIGENGAKLIKNGFRIITHCNAGALATGGIGTALGVIYTARFSGKNISVRVDETRPVLQGARLTTWELDRAGVPYTLICDNMAASLMAAGKIDCAIVGADRIAVNHDIANKIGTYSLAVLCNHHNISFYVAAPTSTFDPDCPDGNSIVIEQRSGEEVRSIRGQLIAPKHAQTLNPAFDITPHELITAIITEHEIIDPSGKA
jgi:methylthioribose-1-phosphate isomerase